MGINSNGSMKVEVILRFLAFIFLTLAALLTCTNSQTKLIFDVVKKEANFKVAQILITSVYVHSIGAGYTLAHLIRCFFIAKHQGDNLTWSSSHFLKWIFFLLDQMAVYIIFSANCAETEFAFLAIFGSRSLQWLKLCSRFVRFCVQIGWSIAFGLLSSILLAFISSISAFNLFRLYSPNCFRLKQQRIALVAAS